MPGRFAIPNIDERYRSVEHLDARREIEGFVDVEIGMAKGRDPAEEGECHEANDGSDPFAP